MILNAKAVRKLLKAFSQFKTDQLQPLSARDAVKRHFEFIRFQPLLLKVGDGEDRLK
jgi:hypothetical protein